MNPRKATAVVALFMINQLAFADASYQSTTQITGGTLVETLQKVSFMSHSIKDMLAPISTTTMVHGNQKAVISKDSTEITDLDGERIIHIDNLKKTYTVMTFAEMRQAFLNMSKQMDKAQAQMKQEQPTQPQQPSDIKTTFDVKVNNTGATKVVNGLEAQEQIITMTMKVTATNPPPPSAGHPADPNAPTSMDYTVTTDAWVAPDPPEIKEIADFDIRFGEKLMQGVDMKEFADQFKHMQGSRQRSHRQAPRRPARRWRCHGPDGQRDSQAQRHPRPRDHQHGRPRTRRHRDRIRLDAPAHAASPSPATSPPTRPPRPPAARPARSAARPASSPALSPAPSWEASTTRRQHRRRPRPCHSSPDHRKRRSCHADRRPHVHHHAEVQLLPILRLTLRLPNPRRLQTGPLPHGQHGPVSKLGVADHLPERPHATHPFRVLPFPANKIFARWPSRTVAGILILQEYYA